MEYTPSNQLNSTDSRECIECGHNEFTVTTETQTFLYGDTGKEVELTAHVPVWSCTNCGFSYTDEAGEIIRHEAVCAHLGVLTPAQIKELRKRTKLSQADFAKLTGFGEASIKRWETGALVQNTSADRFMRLLLHFYPHSIQALQAASQNLTARDTSLSQTKRPRFRTSLSQESLSASHHFQLRQVIN
ncbi:type II toxin-antitoxin system MqsA family antitoxin [Pyxidicoccus fallax]|uniref:Type II toxin-antitoxin system MqsA family antitoxin n=1 Tax=Pyxidicoccus fallax TaxID=394095 RepID=A0A848LT53_9BACT|nr:type II toxin-antitoxin system MqsA family antitoxin [Pyxidicoccus fallax]NPC85136.1 type II toxin-antitoxin system MqsA family antitoxin [Pyxidicoccus fallax]